MARIAVIDDDMAMDILTESLRNWGHDAFRISLANDAISRLKEVVLVNLVILDVIILGLLADLDPSSLVPVQPAWKSTVSYALLKMTCP